MKTLITFVLLIIVNLPVFTQEPAHFRIYADIQKDAYFKEILKETYLDEVFTRKFQIVVNIYPAEFAFIVIGRYESPDVEWDREAYRYDWTFLSKPLREKILRYKNKIILR